MCSRPITKDNQTFACRSCDECIAVRRASWIARAMMEKTQYAHTLCVALTYSDDTQENRDAAAMFAYGDVRAFLKRLLRASNYVQPGSRVRFICAGEQGDRNGRCHWHLILYSDLDLTKIGTFSVHGKIVTESSEMLTKGKRKIRLDWSMWGKGFVTLQEPDQGGMAYVLSYCLKDQFASDKVRGTARESKSENFATGLFRMSKRPPIGSAWIMQKMEHLDALGAVLPSLQIKIPDMSGYWHPNGSFREVVLWSLVALNQRIFWRTGRYAPQWSALLASCQDNLSDMDILNAFQRPKPDDEQGVEAELRLRGEEYTRAKRLAQTAFRCGGLYPCISCLGGFDTERLAAIGLSLSVNEYGAETFTVVETGEAPDPRDRHPSGGINPDCQGRDGLSQREAFPRSNSNPWADL